MKTTWDLSGLYHSATDKNIERDIRALEQRTVDFVALYKDVSWNTASLGFITQALKDWQTLQEASSEQPLIYWYLSFDTEQQRTDIYQKYMQCQERFQKMGAQLTFFELGIGGLPISMQNRMRGHAPLVPFAYYLDRLWATHRHTLSQQEEELLSELSSPLSSMWGDMMQKQLTSVLIKHKGKDLPLTTVSSMLSTMTSKDRRRAWVSIVEALQRLAPIAEAEINALCARKKVLDHKRRHTAPYESRCVGDEIDPHVVKTLVREVTRSAKIVHEFYRLKAKLLGVSTLAYVDRSVSVGTTKKSFTREQEVALVARAFARIDVSYAETLYAYAEEGRIDFEPRQGKAGGGYCLSTPHIAPYILLNSTGRMRDASTLAHEMGHAFHAIKTNKAQSILYRGHSTATAEVASTFFEHVLFDTVFETLSHREQIVALHDKIQDAIASIWRQVDLFRFEERLHAEARTESYVSHRKIAQLLTHELRQSLGPAVTMTEDDGYTFVSWSHIRRPFYVYSYASGSLISNALFAMWRSNPAEGRAKLEAFLSAGTSASAQDIFASIGIAIDTPAFWRAGIKNIERDIKQLAKLMDASPVSSST